VPQDSSFEAGQEFHVASVHPLARISHVNCNWNSDFVQMPFRGAGLVAPASRRQFYAAAGVQKIAGGTPALPNPNLDDEACDRRTDPSNRRVKPKSVFYPEQFPPQGALSVHFPLQFQPRLRIRCRDSAQRQRKSQSSHRSGICVPLRKSHRHTWSPALESHFSEFLRM